MNYSIKQNLRKLPKYLRINFKQTQEELMFENHNSNLSGTFVFNLKIQKGSDRFEMMETYGM